jgi:hypothetical protein
MFLDRTAQIKIITSSEPIESKNSLGEMNGMSDIVNPWSAGFISIIAERFLISNCLVKIVLKNLNKKVDAPQK